MTSHRYGPRALTAMGVMVALLLTGCGTRQSTEQLAQAEAGQLAGAQTVPDAQGAIQADGDGSTAGAQPGQEASAVAGEGATGTAAGQVGTGGPVPTGSAGGVTAAGAGSSSTKGGAGATAQSGGPGGNAAGNPTTCSKAGTPIILGQVGGFSGVISAAIANARPALAAWAASVNARGGVACHPIKVFAVDDASDPVRAAAAVKDLVQNKGAIAIVGSAPIISISGFRSAVESLKVPAVGGDALNDDWTESPMLFPQGSTFVSLVLGGLKYYVKEMGKTKIGVVNCVESTNCTVAANYVKNGGAERVGGSLVYSGSASLTQTDFTAQCQSAKSAGAEVLELALDGSAIARLAKSCAAIGYFPGFSTSAAATSASQAKDPNINKAGFALPLGQWPWFLAKTPAQQAFATAMARYAPNVTLDASTTAAWTSGLLFEKVIESLGAKAQEAITTAAVLEGLGKIKNETLGGTVPGISFKPGQAKSPVVECYYPVYLKDGKYAAPNGDKPVCL